MNPRFIKPDFQNNILNISATIAQYLGCPNDKPTLPLLAQELNKDYKNIVFVILDGLGIHPLNQNLAPDCFLRKNVKQVLTSVFPSTTTNATTTFLTNQYPMEHGWFGWSLYFEDISRAIDIFLDSDSFTGERLEKGYVQNRMPILPYYKRANSDYTTSLVVPEYWNQDSANKHVWKSFDEMLLHIESICKKNGKQFLYTYYDQPDSTMHRCGVSSAEAQNIIQTINDGLEGLCKRLSDTLFIITADHGQIDVDGYIDIYQDEVLAALLEWPQFLEARATAFKVKQECEKEFIALFNQKYGADFELFKVEDLIRENYFGGNFAGKYAKLLGDFIAIGTTNKIMRLTPFSHDFKGHHTSLTEEMQVPLILVGNRE